MGCKLLATIREFLSLAKVLGAARTKPYPTHPHMPPTILIADDHPLFREALKLAISQAFVGAQTFEADTVDSLLTRSTRIRKSICCCSISACRGTWLFRRWCRRARTTLRSRWW